MWGHGRGAGRVELVKRDNVFTLVHVTENLVCANTAQGRLARVAPEKVCEKRWGVLCSWLRRGCSERSGLACGLPSLAFGYFPSAEVLRGEENIYQMAFGFLLGRDGALCTAKRQQRRARGLNEKR